jgi:hypothetical protein
VLLRVLDLVDEELQLHDVPAAEVENARGGQAVSAGTARFLVVVLDGLRQVAVKDEADVGFVDAHAEGDGGDDDVDVVPVEGFLVPGPLQVPEAGVVGEGLDAVAGEEGGGRFHVFSGGAVDDAGFPGVLFQEGEDLIIEAAFWQDAVVEIGPVERRPHLERVAQTELADRVPLDLLGGGGGEGGDGHGGEVLPQAREEEVVGAELVAPLRDAVRLVDGKEADADLFQFLQERVEGEALRGRVEEVQVARVEIVRNGASFGRRLRRVHEGRAQAVLAGPVHLVLHERDEGADDDAAAGKKVGGELVAEGLAPSRGHHHEGVPAAEDGLDDLFLVLPEGVEAEELLQRGVQVGIFLLHRSPGGGRLLPGWIVQLVGRHLARSPAFGTWGGAGYGDKAVPVAEVALVHPVFRAVGSVVEVIRHGAASPPALFPGQIRRRRLLSRRPGS